MGDSSVKVGVRIRPLLAKEHHQANCLNNCDAQSIQFRNQTYSFDHVFGLDVSQQELYECTAAPMLKSFLDGYNVTIMAYGQTGSGKSYTMGTSDSTIDSEGCEGLIPRFVFDLFANLAGQGSAQSDGAKYSQAVVSVSFMEIYGEDVFDLIPEDGRSGGERPPLLVRENEAGCVVVQGLQQIEVHSADQAVGYLYSGMKNRITAATLMNSASSRSHAVYVVTLDQTSGSDEDGQRMSSRLTFVDLAGSERIGRTHAEGKLKKEGIQINSGLFCLGQVINGLADDQRLKNGLKQTHIPYRNSKLTHLLKDALGGNSQTLFLACVSPADSNESETHSTLTYAKAARNIKNKPVRNMDKTQMEIIRLRYAVKAWTLKAVAHLLVDEAAGGQRVSLPLPDLSPAHPSQKTQSLVSDILNRSDVQEYIRNVNRAIEEKLECGATASPPRKVRLSIGVCNQGQGGAKLLARSAIARAQEGGGAVRNLAQSFEGRANEPPTPSRGGRKRGSALGVRELGVARDLDPDESERLVARMQEMVAQERELVEKEAEDEEELREVDQAIEEKESILTKLMETVKGFAVIKADYEKLVEEIGSLESERVSLERELEKSKRVDQHGASKVNTAQLESMKARYEKVKVELEGHKDERRRKEQAYKLMQREARTCDTLQTEIQKLKESKVILMREQKSAAQQIQKLKKEQQTMNNQSKRTEVEKTKQVNTLKSELSKKERVLGVKDKEIGRVYSKLKACEEHITQLLKMNRSRSRVMEEKSTSSESFSLTASDLEHLGTSRKLMDSVVSDKVLYTCARAVYERKSAMLADLNRELQDESKEMESLVSSLEALVDVAQCRTPGESFDEDAEILRRSIRAGEATIDRITRDLDTHNADLDEIAARISSLEKSSNCTNFDRLGKNIVIGLKAPQLQSYCWDLINEKLEALESLRLTRDLLEEKEDKLAGCEEKVKEYEGALAKTNKEFKNRLNQAEKQRHNDLWTIMRAKGGTTSSEDMAISQLVDSVGQEIAMQRALELEFQLEEYLEQDAKLRQENAALLNRIQTMELLRGSASPNAAPQQELMESLTTLWHDIGASTEDRERMLHEINNASSIAIEKYRTSAKIALQNATSNKGLAERNIDAVCSAFMLDKDDSIQLSTDSIPVLQLEKNLELALTKLVDSVKDRVASMAEVRARLASFMSEMSLSVHDLSPELRLLSSVPQSESDVVALAHQLRASGVVVTAESVESWRRELSKLNVKRTSTTLKAAAVKEEAIRLVAQLGFFDELSLHSLAMKTDDAAAEAVRVAVDIVMTGSASNPPGSDKLLSALEHVRAGLLAVSAEREKISGHLSEIIRCTGGRLDGGDAGSTVRGKDELINLFDSASESILYLCDSAPQQLESIRANKVTVYKFVSELALADSDVVDTRLKYNSTLMHRVDRAVEGLIEESAGVGEKWLQLCKADLINLLNSKMNDVEKALAIQKELDEVSEISAIVESISKTDQLIVEHTCACDVFESNSKHDRIKALSGSSKQLVDEEKFRKQSKKKFEALSAQLLAAVQSLQQHCVGKYAISLSALSAQSMEMVNGKAQEKTELMHLHTTTLGTRRWSGDREVLGEIGSDALASAGTPSPTSTSSLPQTAGPENNVNKGVSAENMRPPSPPSRARSDSPSKLRSTSPLRPRAVSPSRSTPLAQPLWYPHTKPLKPTPLSAAKRMFADDAEAPNAGHVKPNKPPR